MKYEMKTSTLSTIFTGLLALPSKLYINVSVGNIWNMIWNISFYSTLFKSESLLINELGWDVEQSLSPKMHLLTCWVLISSFNADVTRSNCRISGDKLINQHHRSPFLATTVISVFKRDHNHKKLLYNFTNADKLIEINITDHHNLQPLWCFAIIITRAKKAIIMLCS